MYIPAPSRLGFLPRSDTGMGMLFMIVAMLLVPLGDAFTKLLTGTLDPLEITLWRLLAQGAFMLPVALILRGRMHGRMFSPVVALSGLLVAGSLVSLISAFAVMPIATAIAIFFVEPLILTLLAGPLLGEVPGPRRLIAVGVGLIGALIVIRPGFSAYGLVTVLPVIAATCYALNMIVLRRASRVRSVLTVQCGATFYATLLTALFLGLMVTTGHAERPTLALPPASWAIIAAMGMLATLTFVLIGEAFRRTEASILAPFQYLEIIGATALGYFIFGNLPDALTWLGVAIILCSGIYVFHRERLSSTRAPRTKRAER